MQGIKLVLKGSHEAVLSLLRSVTLGLRVDRAPVIRIAHKVSQSTYIGRERIKNILKSEIRQKTLEMTRGMDLASATHRLQMANR